MKRYFFFSFLLLSGSILHAQTAQLQRLFVAPPASARPCVWWHWMNGNVTKDGIRKDIL